MMSGVETKESRHRDQGEALAALLHECSGTRGLTCSDVALHLSVSHGTAERLLSEAVAHDAAVMAFGDELEDADLAAVRYHCALAAPPPPRVVATLAAVRADEPTPRAQAQVHRWRATVLALGLLLSALGFFLLAPARPSRPEKLPTPTTAAPPAPSALVPVSPLVAAAMAHLATRASAERATALRTLETTGDALQLAAAECATTWHAAPQERCYSGGRLLTRRQLTGELHWLSKRKAELEQP